MDSTDNQPRRMKKVNSLLKEAISESIMQDCSQYNLPKLITVTRVDTSKDLRTAKVYVSIIAKTPEEKTKTIALLQKHSGMIAYTTASKVVLRYFPTLTFYLDDTVDAYMKIDTLLKKIHKSTDDETGNSTC